MELLEPVYPYRPPHRLLNTKYRHFELHNETFTLDEEIRKINGFNSLAAADQEVLLKAHVQKIEIEDPCHPKNSSEFHAICLAYGVNPGLLGKEVRVDDLPNHSFTIPMSIRDGEGIIQENWRTLETVTVQWLIDNGFCFPPRLINQKGTPIDAISWNEVLESLKGSTRLLLTTGVIIITTSALGFKVLKSPITKGILKTWMPSLDI